MAHGRAAHDTHLLQIHFDVHAFDLLTARPLWTTRVYSQVSQDGDMAPIVSSPCVAHCWDRTANAYGS